MLTGLGGIASLAAAAGAVAYAVRSPRSSLLAPSVYQGSATRKSVALTFDDGPSPSTPQLVDLLARYNAAATFFQCGANVQRLPAIARSVAAAGHEIGNHTFSHPALHFKSPDFMYREIRKAQQVIEDCVQVTPRLFRAPFGVRWFGLADVQRRLNLQGVMWSVIGLDWKLPVNAVLRRLLRAAAPGAIICLHDGRLTHEKPDIATTLDTIRKILPIWAGEGYKFETVSQILCKTN